MGCFPVLCLPKWCPAKLSILQWHLLVFRIKLKLLTGASSSQDLWPLPQPRLFHLCLHHQISVPELKATRANKQHFLADICTGHLYLSVPRLSFPQISTRGPPLLPVLSMSVSEPSPIAVSLHPISQFLLLGRAYCCLNFFNLCTWSSLLVGKLKVPPVSGT